MKKQSLAVLVPMLMGMASQSVLADDTTTTTEPTTTLDTISIQATRSDAEKDYVTTVAPNLLKSNDSLFETAKSVSVITEEQLKQKQATTVSEALKGVAGVSTGQYGRRGWDDFVIRGQLANSQVMIDGMRTATSTNFLNSFDVSGLESVEVVKGPDSVGFGQLMPAGVVNLTTKKPKANSFQEVSISAGSDGFIQGAFDVNYAKNNSTDGAFRINGRVADSDDPTNDVYFKNYYIAPSYHFNLNDKTDMTLLASYQASKYVRQQGMPSQNNVYKNYPSNFFFGDPNRYLNDESVRLGYQLNHDFDNDWHLKQNFAFTKREADGSAVLANTARPMTGSVMRRQLNDQLKQDTILSLDTNVNKSFYTGNVSHDVMVGVDGFRERSDYAFYTCTFGTMDLNNPQSANNNCTSALAMHNNHALNHLQYVGLYAKNTMRTKGFDDDSQWLVSVGGRHDWSQVQSDSRRTGLTTKNSDNAFTANASVMYDWHNMVAPYVSYATSFLPTTDKGQDGSILDPETGEQFEVGVKLQSLDQRIQGTLSYYDLTRKDVAESNGDYYVAVGEQNTKGYEAEVKAMLNDQWNVSASYSYIPTADVIKATAKSNYRVGQRINHVPKNTYSLGTQYYFDPSQKGWYVGGMYRHEDAHHAERGAVSIDLPSYNLLDLEAGYQADKWRLGMMVQNVTDEDYYSGTSPNASMVTYGDPRSYRMTLSYQF